MKLPRAAVAVGLVGLLLVAFPYLNAVPVLQQLPLGLSTAGLALAAVAIAGQMLGPVGATSGLSLVLALWLLFAVQIPAGPWSPYAHAKVVDLFTVSLVSTLGGVYLLRQPRARSMWLALIVLLGAMCAGLSLLLPNAIALESGRLAIEGGSAITAARGIGAAVVVLAMLGLGGARGRWYMFGGALVLMVVMLQTGSRGPVMAAGIATLAAALVPARGRALRFLLSVAVIALSWWVAVSSDYAGDRFSGIGQSGDMRPYLWGAAADQIEHHPLGLTWGGLSPYMRGDAYPHNVALGVLAEGGWVVGSLTILFVCVALATQCRSATTGGRVELAMLGVFVFYLVNALVSSDLPGNRGLWVAAGAGLALSSQPFALPRFRSVSRNRLIQRCVVKPEELLAVEGRASRWTKVSPERRVGARASESQRRGSTTKDGP